MLLLPLCRTYGAYYVEYYHSIMISSTYDVAVELREDDKNPSVDILLTLIIG